MWLTIGSGCLLGLMSIFQNPQKKIASYSLFTTEIAIREVEQQYGFSASNADFFDAVDAS